MAANDLPIGHRLTAADLRVQAGATPRRHRRRASFDSVAGAVGGVTLAPLRAGDIVQRSAVLAPATPAATGAGSSRSPSERERVLDGALQPGEHVDVLATYGSGDGAFTNVVARDVALVDIDAGAKSAAIGSSTKLTFTVALSDADDVLRLAHATQVAPITLVRTSGSSATGSGGLDTVHSPTTATTAARSAAGSTTTSSSSSGGNASSTAGTTNGTQRSG